MEAEIKIKKTHDRPLELKNILLTGKIPLKRKLNRDEVTKIINNSALNWVLVNEERSPTLNTCFNLSKDSPINKNSKNNKVSFSIGISGNVCITGIKKKKDAYICYDLVFSDLIKFINKAIDEDKMKGGIK